MKPEDEARAEEIAQKTADLLDTYGLEHQSYKAIEEMSELSVALLKWWDTDTTGDTVSMLNLRDNVIDELADVSLMISQLVYGFNAVKEVLARRDYKIERQLSRINIAKTSGNGRFSKDDPWEDDKK